MWRKSAAEVLMTLSRHGLTPPVVGYIHCELSEHKLACNLYHILNMFIDLESVFAY